jgi:Putative Actinobacterial Holin-X, holin superfamily III
MFRSRRQREMPLQPEISGPKKGAVMSTGSSPTESASTGELVSQLTAQTSRLVRDEIRLALKEFQASAKHAGVGAGLFSVAGVLALFGIATLIAAAVAAIAIVLPVWAAALIVGVALLVVGGIAAVIGKRQVQEASPVPQQTVANVKEDIQEVKDARHDRT